MRFTLLSVPAALAMITSRSLTSGASAPQLPTRMMVFTPKKRTSSVA